MLIESLTRCLQDAKSGVHAEVALVCYVDLCQAALLLPASLDDLTLRSFAPDLIEEIYVRLALVLRYIIAD